MRPADIYENGNSGNRVFAMEGMRGLAVVLVFFVHFYQLYGQYLPAGSLTAKFLRCAAIDGHTGVDLFFLLSGYLIYGAARSGRKSIPEFLARRAQRIYPAFLVVFAVYVATMLAAPAHSKLPATNGATVVYLLQNVLLLPGLFEITPLITVAWSLSYEVFYYGALPLVYGICGMRRWSGEARAAAVVALTAAYCFCCYRWWSFEIPAIALNPAQHPRLILFAAGILVYEALTSLGIGRRLTRRVEWAAIALTAAALTVVPPMLGIAHGQVLQASLLFVTFGLLGLCCLGLPHGILARFFSWTPLRWLGNMSYSYYLCHALVLQLLFVVVSRVPGYRSVPAAWPLLIVSFAATWVASTVLFVCVEKPLSLAGQRRRETMVAVAAD